MFRNFLLVTIFAASSLLVGAQTEVRVKQGDTLASIAEQYQIPIEQLARKNHLKRNSRLRKGQRLLIPDDQSESASGDPGDGVEIIGKRIKLADGRTIEVDEAWKEGSTIWFRRGNMTQSLETEVKSIESIVKEKPVTQPVASETAAKNASNIETWIHLVGGAKFKVDDLSETATGAWYSRGSLSVFLERERIERIVREDPSATAGRRRDWSSGNARIDELIRINGTRFGVDPYLVFCVIEHESHFQTRAVSPKGARGLMQLMPATARRLGVKNSFDVAENIRAGTQYLRELMTMFGGQVNLVLASYNAGEGAVLKYGRNVPPYRETRDYVKRIGKRYGLGAREVREGDDPIVPRR